ncbi:MAG: hypothetical protein QGE95_10715 [Arenicellales bacterium]|jgi:hypothetical protein|nr:hypothetical protein [Pseudomonadales bacterium]MDP7452725.1 hypothetical protein [Arenicellales bacterium]
MQIQSPLADIRLSIDSIGRDGSMLRLDTTQQPGQIPTAAYLTPAEVARFVCAFLQPSLLWYLLRIGRHSRRFKQGIGIPKSIVQRANHPTPTPW